MKQQKAYGYLDDMNEQQREDALELKWYMQNELKYNGRDLNLHTALRFCRARNFDMNKAKAQVKEYCEWSQRKDKLEMVDFQNHFKVEIENLHFGLYHIDKQGDPVVIDMQSLQKYDKVMKEHTLEDLEDYYYQYQRRLFRICLPIASEFKKQRVEKFVMIMDFKGKGAMSFLSGTMKKIIKQAGENSQKYFPESLKQMFIINAPTSFSIIYNFAKLFLDKKTQKKIQIISGNSLKELQKYIDLDKIPDFLGGQCKDKLSDNPGPWQKEFLLSFKEKRFDMKDLTLFNKYYLTDEEYQQVKQLTKQKQSKSNQMLQSLNPDQYSIGKERSIGKSMSFTNLVTKVNKFDQFIIRNTFISPLQIDSTFYIIIQFFITDFVIYFLCVKIQ